MFESSSTACTICHNIKELQFATYGIYVFVMAKWFNTFVFTREEKVLIVQ
jgi:hypothetical protein